MILWVLPSAKKGLPRIAQIYTDFFAFGKIELPQKHRSTENNTDLLLCFCGKYHSGAKLLNANLVF